MKPTGLKPSPIIRPGFVLFLVILFAVWLVIPSLLTREPSFARQRIEQRKVILERVQAAGGWGAVRLGCESLYTNMTNSLHNNFYWQPPWTNAHVMNYSNSVLASDYITNLDYGPLPPAIASLLPREISTDRIAGGAIMVKIKLFGMHRTGLWDIPYYGLWAVCNSTNQDYTPESNPPFYKGVNKVADSIFEVYQ